MALVVLLTSSLYAETAPVTIRFPCVPADLDDAGLECTERAPCRIFLELTGVEAFLNKIFLTGNLHAADTTLSSVFLASFDSGKTWTEPVARMPSTTLDQIQFIDFEHGWISGANVAGIPRDPFFLMTTDGGQTWTRRAVFEESRTGIIDRFSFDSPSAGQMIVSTRFTHELFETKTGGGGWSLVRSSKQALQLTQERTSSDPTVRIRPDSKLHAYQIEKHDAGKWLPAATFVIEVARCQE